MTQRWKNKPPGSNWGEFGPDDQRGRMNLVTREKVLQGIAEVKEGITFCCRPLVEFNENMTDVICDDQVLMSLQYSTQWDSFAHVGSRFDADGDGKAELVFYNGFRAGDHVSPASENQSSESWAKYEGTQAKALGIENL